VLLGGVGGLSYVQRLLGCNHFHLAKVIRGFVGNDESLTIAEVSKSKSRLFLH
jgi:hypothetical protein